MKTTTQFIICFLLSFSVVAQSDKDYLNLANKKYDSGDKVNAKKLYEKAAALNNPDAHFALAYKYFVTREETIYHYSEAAKKGHSEAISELFDFLILRSSSLSLTNPELAYEIYTEAKKDNPNLQFFWDDEIVRATKECIEAGPFDVKTFINKYKITEKDTNASDYAIWELAAEASHDGRFGVANPKLVLQLACKGGDVPAEKLIAVIEAYDHWKNNEVVLFDPCNYAGSGVGLAYCSEKESAKLKKEYDSVVRNMEIRLRNNAGPLLKEAYASAVVFIEEKAFNEEGSDGSGFVAWANSSADQQKADYIDLVNKVNDGFHPNLNTLKDYDKELNTTYKAVVDRLRKEPIKGCSFEINDHVVRRVERLWIRYRDSSAKLFAKISPLVSEQQWKDYLTDIRTSEIKGIDSLRY